MDAGQVAALVAAAFFAAGMCAAVYVLVKLAGLIAAATAVVTGYQAAAEDLMRRAGAAVDRADEQLARTAALAESVGQVSASMTELSEQVSVVSDTVRLIAAGLGAPVLRLAAAGHGFRRALASRRADRADRTGRAGWVDRAGGSRQAAPAAPAGPRRALRYRAGR